MLQNCFINSAAEHWFGCRTTERGFSGDIGTIYILLIDWLILPCSILTDPSQINFRGALPLLMSVSGNALHSNPSSVSWLRRYLDLKQELTKTSLIESIRTALISKNKLYTEWKMTPLLSSAERKSIPSMERYRVSNKQYRTNGGRTETKVQMYTETHNDKKFFNSLKTGYCPLNWGCSPLLLSDGTTLIKVQAGLKQWWTEHFSIRLIRPYSVDPPVLHQIPHQPILNSLDSSPHNDRDSKGDTPDQLRQTIK